MKSFTIEFKDKKGLIDFIHTNSLKSYKNIFVQVFSGVMDTKYLLDITSTIKQNLPKSNLIGVSTSGEIYNAKIYNGSIIITFAIFEDTKVRSKLYKFDKDFNFKNIADDLIRDNTKAMLLFSDGLNNNAESLLKGIHSLKLDMIIAGGRAGDNLEFKNTFVFDESDFCDSGCVIATLSSDRLLVNSNYILNWTSIGKDMIVTKVEGNILYELDGMPILEIYRKYLGEDSVKNIPKSCMDFPLIIKRNGLEIARDPVRRTKDALIFAGEFEKGDSVRFSFANIEDLIDNVDEYFDNYSKFPSEAIFVYSCTARKQLLGDRFENELNILESIAPTSGFFTYGEYFHSSDIVELLNVTTTFVALSESPKVKNKVLKIPNQNIRYDSVKKALTHLVKVTTEELEHISTHDELTTIYNRAEYLKRVYIKLKSARRYNEHFGLILVDIDHFKLVNDNYGHGVGDEILKKFAKVLYSNIREDDFVARWGGEEFVIIANYVTVDDLEKLTKKLQKHISETSFLPVPKVTASFGLTIYMDGDNDESIFKRVDNALYTAKQNGRNTYVIG